MTSVVLTRRGFLAIMILYLTFLIWYVFPVYILRHVGLSTETNLIAGASFNFLIAITLLLNSFFIHRFNKIHIIYGSSIVASIVTLLLLFVSSPFHRLIIIYVSGVFFGTGQLAFFTYFWNLTIPEERGRVAGLVGFFSLPIFYLVSLIAETFDYSTTVMLGVILSLGPLGIRLLRPEKKESLTANNDEKGYHPEKRVVFLYTIPWILFSLINATLARNISFYVLQSVPFSYYMFLVALQFVAALFGALSGGIIADFFGRRLSLVFGLTLYGIGSVLTGLIKNYDMFSLVYIANGLNWGILLTLYVFVVWGDLATKESCAKSYSIGLIIFYSTTGVGILLTPRILRFPIAVNSLVSCLLIFLSNILLILAPELLSSDFRERIKLKLYMNVVRKIGRKLSQDHG